MNQQKDSSCDPLTPEGHNTELQAEDFWGTFGGGWMRLALHPSTVVGLFRLGTTGQELQPAWTIRTFINLQV